LCFPHDDDYDDHGVRRANTAQALAWWRRLGASHEAADMLHRAMCLVPYCPIGMVIAIAVEYVTFYFFINNRVGNNLINTPSINRFR
jgi:hypothetical protein